MKIADIRAQTVDVGQGFVWGGREKRDVIGTFLTIVTEDGLEGYALAWTGSVPASIVSTLANEFAKPLLVGLDPHERPNVRGLLAPSFKQGVPRVLAGMVDVALWDLAGKAVNLPIADLLGRTRSKITACASAPTVDDPGACREMVSTILEAGFRAVKLHVCGDTLVDIACCEAAREVAGDDVSLMMDAMGIYSRGQALALGRALDDLGYRWFEDPLPDSDLTGYVELRQAIDTPLAGVDSVRHSLEDYATGITRGAWDIVRMDGARDGISELSDLARVARTFGISCEGHSFGPALAQAANLQVALSTTNGEFFELPVPLGGLDAGVRKGFTLDNEGAVHAPAGPGLGLEVDLDAMAALVVRA